MQRVEMMNSPKSLPKQRGVTISNFKLHARLASQSPTKERNPWVKFNQTAEAKNSISFAKNINRLFLLIDINSDGIISTDDIANFTKKYLSNLNILKLTAIEIFSWECKLTFSEFYRTFQEGRKMCKNFATFFENKIKKFDEKMKKKIDRINFQKLVLSISKNSNEEFSLWINDSLSQGREIDYELSSSEDNIKIAFESRVFVLEISKYFLDLFLKDDNCNCSANEATKSPLWPLIMRIHEKSSICELDKQALQRKKNSLLRSMLKKRHSQCQLDYYLSILTNAEQSLERLLNKNNPINIAQCANDVDWIFTIHMEGDEEIKRMSANPSLLQSPSTPRKQHKQTCFQKAEHTYIHSTERETEYTQEDSIFNSYQGNNLFQSKVHKQSNARLLTQVISQVIIEEPASCLIDDKLKNLCKISSEGKTENIEKCPMISLLFFACQCHSLLGGSHLLTIGKEFIHELKKKK